MGKPYDVHAKMNGSLDVDDMDDFEFISQAKHVLSGECECSMDVKMTVWRKFFSEIMDAKGSSERRLARMLDFQKGLLLNADLESYVVQKGQTMAKVNEWIINSDGVFESFELDCALHDMDSSRFFIYILLSGYHTKMAEGLIDFQDDDTKNRLFKELSGIIISPDW